MRVIWGLSIRLRVVAVSMLKIAQVFRGVSLWTKNPSPSMPRTSSTSHVPLQSVSASAVAIKTDWRSQFSS